MNRIISSSLIIGLIAVSCSDPNTIGLEVQPSSDYIIISNTNFESISSATESQDSIQTVYTNSLILGEISEAVFGSNTAGFYTQILLKENNTDLGNNSEVDSVILSYSYSDYYGDLKEFGSLDVTFIEEEISKDSIYYSNSFEILKGNEYDDIHLSDPTLFDPFLRIKLSDDFGEEILSYGNDALKDNESFLEKIKGISVSVESSEENTMLYLNPNGSNSYLKVYYHNDESGSDTLSLDFELGGDAARINLFNSKPLSNLDQFDGELYIQSMAGYNAKISINNLDSLRLLLDQKPLNKVIMSFDVESGSQIEYSAHDKLFLVRKNQEGVPVFLEDYLLSGNGLKVNDKFEFNITSYFDQLLNNYSYTNDLYLVPAGGAINANRTILNDIKLIIHYSEF
tara:strand:- start:557 stop:1750 length:1194 start_codon:yes stop_codon:yes gene_type:complete